MIANRLVGLAKNRPELDARVPNGVMHELSKLYVDVVGVTTPGAIRAVLDIVPMSHLLFGTDFPFWAPETTIKGLAGLKLVRRRSAGDRARQRAEAAAGAAEVEASRRRDTSIGVHVLGRIPSLPWGSIFFEAMDGRLKPGHDEL